MSKTDKPKTETEGLTRRDFLKGAVATGVTIAAGKYGGKIKEVLAGEKSRIPELQPLLEKGIISSDGVLQNTPFVVKSPIHKILPSGNKYSIQINNNLGQIAKGTYNIIWDNSINTYVFEKYPDLGRVKVMPNDKIDYYNKQHSFERGNVNRLETNEILKLVKNGDIIFQTSLSRQSKAIEAATHSNITHMGMIIMNNGEWQVLEAVQPVKVTSFNKWKNRGKDGMIAIKRVNTDFNFSTVLQSANKHLGKNYDVLFDWGDQSIYCSELVYKAYKEATGIAIGELTKLKDLDFSTDKVQNIFLRRLGVKLGYSKRKFLSSLLKKYKTFSKLMISPNWIIIKKMLSQKVIRMLESPIITPKSMFDSANLQTIYDEYQ
jgi:hypothetical protein